MPELLYLELALLGLCSGFLAGLLGVGGGMVLVPFLTYFLGRQGLSADLAVKMAIATAMATIVFTSLSSLRAHHRRGAVRWEIVRSLAPGIATGALLASLGVFALLRGKSLALFFGLFIGFTALRMLRSGSRPGTMRALPGAAGLFGVGSALGFISGLVGAGGAFISVPFMTRRGVAMHQAVGTSAALGLPIAIVNAAGLVFTGSGDPGRPAYSLGYLWLPALLAIACCSVLTAPLGARAAHRLPVAQLKRIFAMLLFTLAGYMLWKGWSAGS
ncbi:sulfite exporter TauE/SafE family protein [Delftia sp. PS-11]|uniref:sulfite exporter TauE/SafE family protein n=1 Tax=Delftia sp. PS-11 TaxID=2767222 RepID=UPI002457D19C|nr:sulfite exporter TauE/SafE family protein [Delftia sp. PS-11]KAJ8745539.1 sulfite exporter TauE/SafE family protein [Delftia sp. PS-11]